MLEGAKPRRHERVLMTWDAHDEKGLYETNFFSSTIGITATAAA